MLWRAMLQAAVGPPWPVTLPGMGPPQLLWPAHANSSLLTVF